jgi:glycosyltransferase involved in cell wall biosynthesis
MKISVIIPTLNSEAYLRPAIESVLNQTLPAFETIIVDSESRDNTQHIALSYADKGVKIVQSSQTGAAAKRNIGVKHATGDYLAFLDSDDVWTLDKLEIQQSILKKDPSIQGVFGYVQQFVSPDLSDDQKNRYAYDPNPQAGYHIGCLLIDRKSFLKVGYLSEELKAGEFIEWYVRAQQKSITFKMVDNLLLHRRIHGQNMMLSNSATLHAEYLKVIRMKLKAPA